MGLGVMSTVVSTGVSRSTRDTQAQVQMSALQVCIHPLRCLLLRGTEVPLAWMCAKPLGLGQDWGIMEPGTVQLGGFSHCREKELSLSLLLLGWMLPWGCLF